jgi:hypothetical protein
MQEEAAATAAVDAGGVNLLHGYLENALPDHDITRFWISSETKLAGGPGAKAYLRMNAKPLER